MLREALTPFLTACQGIGVMRCTIQTRSLLTACLAMFALEASLAGAENAHGDRTPQQSGVSLLPPEVLEPDGMEPAPITSLTGWAEAAVQLAMRDDVRADPLNVDQSTQPFLPISTTGRMRAGLFLLCAGSASLGIWLAFGYRRPNQSTTIAVSAKPTGEADFLKSLIGNSLLVIEESLLYPRMVRLHGLPMASERYRVDAAHPVGDPHFPPVPVEEPVETDVIHRVSAPESGIRIPTYRRHGASHAEREMAIVEGAD